MIFKLSMSTYYDMTDKQAKSVLLHEMIHYIIGYTGLKDTASHGVVFRGMMDKLNRKLRLGYSGDDFYRRAGR